MKTPSDILTNLLTHYGMVFSEINEHLLEYLAPITISETLRISEYGKFNFSPQAAEEGAIAAFHDSELFQSLEKFLHDKGRILNTVYSSDLPDPAKFSKIIAERIGFSNATFRFQKEETKNIFYLLVIFKYVALSDDKQEGLLPVLINTQNSSVVFPQEDLVDILDGLKDSGNPSLGALSDLLPAVGRACQAGQTALKERLKDFRKGLEKRLNRDIRRIYEYYETLHTEAEKLTLRHAKNPDGREHNNEKSRDKLQTIQMEKQWKIQDMISKYALNISLAPIFIFRIETHSILFWIEIKRRMYSRNFPLTYNPLLKRLDPLACESCFSLKNDYAICDDQLHIICSECLKVCPRCQKKYCAGCFPKNCPKCKPSFGV